MNSICKKYLVLGALCLFFTLAMGEENVASEAGNEFLDKELSQLMNITITSVSKKEQCLADAAELVAAIEFEFIGVQDALNREIYSA